MICQFFRRPIVRRWERDMQRAIDEIVDALTRDEKLWWTREFAPLRTLVGRLVRDDDESDEEAPPPIIAQQSLRSGDALQEARDAYSAGRFDRAAELADQVLASRPTSVGALRIRGRCAFQAGSYAKARAVLSDAQSLDYDPDVQNTLRECIERLKRASKERVDATCAQSSPASAPKPNDVLSQALGDPAIMDGVAKMLRDPEALSVLQNSDLFKQMENMMQK